MINTTTKTNILKRSMIEALEKTLGVVRPASMLVEATDSRKSESIRQMHYQWLKDDPDYKKAVESIEDIAIDYVEGQNYKLIKELNPAAIIFYLKTKGKRRGYQESMDLTTKGQPIAPNFNVSTPEAATELTKLYGKGHTGTDSESV